MEIGGPSKKLSRCLTQYIRSLALARKPGIVILKNDGLSKGEELIL